MNLPLSVQDYVNKMVTEVPGMKALLLDKDTTVFVSMVHSQSAILQKEVYLVESVDNVNRERMFHLKAVVFVRPTEENMRTIVTELKNPKFSEYYLYFSNLITDRDLEMLAQADEFEVVRKVQEFYADFVAVNTELYSLNIPSVLPLQQDNHPQRDALLHRVVDGLFACCLALRKKPVVRYLRSNAGSATAEIARLFCEKVEREASLFDFRKTEPSPPLLLILSRTDDPVTPLLTQWTYQAMVHELLQITNNRVDLRDIPNCRKDMQEIVLSPLQDDFFRQTMHMNFGDLGVRLKEFLDDFQARSHSNQNIQSIADMQRFVENYPEFRKLSGNVSKHVAVTSELSRLVNLWNLLDLSEAEQSLACVQNHSEAVKCVSGLLSEGNLQVADRLRLVMLYVLRYEKEPASQLGMFRRMLVDDSSPDQTPLQLLDALLSQYGHAKRSDNLFHQTLLGSAKSKLKRGLKGVTNVYTQHQPLVCQLVDQISKGKLKDTLYPFCGAASKERPQDVIVFILGGVTYEESTAIANFNAVNPQMNVVVGGNVVHNSRSFFNELLASSQQ